MNLRVVDPPAKAPQKPQPPVVEAYVPHRRNPGFPLDLEWVERTVMNRSAHPHQPIVLIGFSYGADDVILIARQLNEKQLPVDLLITIDPVTPAKIPSNVKRCVNFYEPNGIWDIFPWLRGVPVEGSSTIENINIGVRLKTFI